MKVKAIGVSIVKPSLTQKARNFLEAIKRQIANGAKLATRSLRKERAGICSKCEYWSDSGNLWLGECRKCGCSKYKRFFETEQCPINKW